MSVAVSERIDSRSGQLGMTNRAQLLLNAIATGADEENAASVESAIISFLSTQFPTGYKNYFLDDLQYEHSGGGVWQAAVTYRNLADDMVYTFDTTGGTAHITQALETLGVYTPAGIGAPNFGGAIGVTKDSIEGVDIVVPACRWTESYLKLPSFVSESYKLATEALTGRVNASTFRGRDAGEVLFEGIRGSRRGYGPWELTYQFSRSPNAVDLPVGDITVSAKPGWAYMWIRYMDYADSTANMIVKRPIAAVVNRVYYDGNFSNLSIGT